MVSYATVYHKISKTCQHYLLSTTAKHTFLVYNSFFVVFYMFFFFIDFSLLTYVHIVNIILYVCVNVRYACLTLPKMVFLN